MVWLVQLHRDTPLPVPGHHLLVLADGPFQIPGTATVHLVEPEERNGAPGGVNRLHEHLSQPDKVVAARVCAQHWIIAAPAGCIERPIVLWATHRHPTCSPAAGILLFRVEEVGLGVLVNPQRDDIYDLGFGDAGDAFSSRLYRRQAKVVADHRKRGFPGDTFHRGLGKVALIQFGAILTFQKGQHRFRGNVAAEAALKEANGSRPLDHRRRAAKDKAHASGPQIIRLLRELGQQKFTRLRRQPVGDADQLSFFAPDRLQKLFDRHCRTEEHGSPAGGLGQSQELQHPGHVDAFAQRTSNNGSHTQPPGIHTHDELTARKPAECPW